MDSIEGSNVEEILLAKLKALMQAKPFLQGENIKAVFTESEMTLWLVMHLRITLQGEPFCEYFCRPVSGYINETSKALERIGAIACMQAFRQAARLCCELDEAGDIDIESLGERRAARIDSLSKPDHEYLDILQIEFNAAEVSEQLLLQLLHYLNEETEGHRPLK
jgi:hypothetical protein